MDPEDSQEDYTHHFPHRNFPPQRHRGRKRERMENMEKTQKRKTKGEREKGRCHNTTVAPRFIEMHARRL